MSFEQWERLPVAERRHRLVLFRAMREEERRAYQDAEDQNFADAVDDMARQEAKAH